MTNTGWRVPCRAATAVLTALALAAGIFAVTATETAAPSAQAGPYIPCEQWQQMHPGWPCVDVPEPPSQPPTAPSQPPLPTWTPNQPGGGSGVGAGALTPPPVGAGNGTPIVPVPGAPSAAPPGAATPLRESAVPAPDNAPSPAQPGESAIPGAADSPAPPTVPGNAAVRPVAKPDKVTVPEDYVYDPDGNYNKVCTASGPGIITCQQRYDGYKGRHDYCTISPDTLTLPTGTADFRGPCARHDMCYDLVADTGSPQKARCDQNLYQDMATNCRAEFSWFNPDREACLAAANIYYDSVQAQGKGGKQCQPIVNTEGNFGSAFWPAWRAFQRDPRNSPPPSVSTLPPVSNGNSYCADDEALVYIGSFAAGR